ncbi:MAG TPA: OmpH family outer membrane protein [Mucilaginibacter sp.]|jgi:outer membrane protein|nr:OmpH family outer membrane protein [Mucilaginibacter sp.]
MKIAVPVLTKITLVSLLAFSLLACNKPQPAGKPTAVSPEINKETIVYINQDTLLNKYEYARDVTKTLQEKGKEAQGAVQSKGQAIEHEFADYQKNVNSMSADQRQSTEEHLSRERQDFQSYQQNAAAGFQNEQISANNKVYDTIANFAKGYAKEKGYKLVLMYSKANPTILYGDQTLDVTADVIKRLNDAYAKEKK